MDLSMVFSNKVVNILLILHLSAKKELYRSKALFSCFLLGFKLDFLFGLLGIKHLHKHNLDPVNTQYNYRNIHIKKIITIFALKDGT